MALISDPGNFPKTGEQLSLKLLSILVWPHGALYYRFSGYCSSAINSHTKLIFYLKQQTGIINPSQCWGSNLSDDYLVYSP